MEADGARSARGAQTFPRTGNAPQGVDDCAG